MDPGFKFLAGDVQKKRVVKNPGYIFEAARTAAPSIV